MILTDDSARQILFDRQDFFDFVFHHFGDGDSGPRSDCIGDLIGSDGSLNESRFRIEPSFERFEVGLEIEQSPVTDGIGFGGSSESLEFIDFAVELFDRRFDRRDFGDGAFFGLPLSFEELEFFAFFAQLCFEIVSLGDGISGRIATDIGEGHANGIHFGDDFFAAFWESIERHAESASGFVEQVDGFIGEVSRREIAF